MRSIRALLATSVTVAAGLAPAKADVVTEWNAIATTTVAGDTVVNRQSRDLAMVQAAVFDAMNAIRGRYTPALVEIVGIPDHASHEMAAAQAAHDVLVALFPARRAELDASLAATAAAIPDDPPHGRQPKTRGIEAGQQAAAAVLALRAGDHAFDTLTFTQRPAGDGVYQLTPGCSAANMSAPWWGTVTPFTIPDPDAFPLGVPPSSSDAEWLAALAEVRDYGRSDSAVRTPEQTEIALFFLEPSVSSINRLARTLVAQEPVESGHERPNRRLLRHARLFAALNIAQADSYVRAWRSKYGHQFWRPYTAIRAIYGDTTWTPLRQTPCHPELLAAHGALTPAGVGAIQRYMGAAIDVDLTSTSLAGVTRHYTSLEQIIEDVNAARIYAGFHYRSTLLRSNELGASVASWVDDHLMRRRHREGDRDDDEDGAD